MCAHVCMCIYMCVHMCVTGCPMDHTNSYSMQIHKCTLCACVLYVSSFLYRIAGKFCVFRDLDEIVKVYPQNILICEHFCRILFHCNMVRLQSWPC